MTTPTREQVIEWAKEAGLPFESIQAPFVTFFGALHRIVESAHTAGRDQGLREAKEVCEAERQEFREQSARNDGRQSDMAFGSVNSAERIAAAIEQLRGK